MDSGISSLSPGLLTVRRTGLTTIRAVGWSEPSQYRMSNLPNAVNDPGVGQPAKSEMQGGAAKSEVPKGNEAVKANFLNEDYPSEAKDCPAVALQFRQAAAEKGPYAEPENEDDPFADCYEYKEEGAVPAATPAPKCKQSLGSQSIGLPAYVESDSEGGLTPETTASSSGLGTSGIPATSSSEPFPSI